MSDAISRWASNPFFVLGLPTTASRSDVEREGAKLLGMVELGLKAAALYPTPFGPRARTVEQVREAMAELRDPDRRLVHEIWAGVPAASTEGGDVDRGDVEGGDAEGDAADEASFAAPFAALRALGWAP